jgi:hypothetical protein
VPQFQASHAYSPGQLIRQLATPAVGSERVFVCIVGGTSGTEPSWTVTRGAKNTSTTPVFQECTGASAVNGDATNTPTWAAAKAISSAVTLGAIIKRANGASYWICSTAGNTGASEPAWANDTAGTTQTDSTVTWTCLGVVGNFSGGGAPHARLANACATNWFAPGNTIYVGDNHAESQATTINIQPTGSPSTVSRMLCHNHSGSYPPAASDLTTGASISTTGAVNLNFTPTVSGGFYFYGVSFVAGVGQSAAAGLNFSAQLCTVYLDNCSLVMATSASAQIVLSSGAGAGAVTFNNTTVKFANTGQIISVQLGQLTWQNTGQVLASGSSVPNNFIVPGSNSFTSVVLEAVDLSQLTGNIFSASTALGSFLVKDCKLNASATFAIPTLSGMTVQYVRSDSSGTAYKSARYQYEGTETTETSITRVGGASDPSGQAQSRKIVSTGNAQWLRPFQAEPYAIWNSTIGANVTVTVCGTVNAGALPNNDDIWLEVEYLGNASFPVGTIVSTTKSSTLAANAAVASDSSTWNGGGSGAGWSPFKLVATLSSPQPGLPGILEARVRVGKPSATYYIDPTVVLT